MNMALNKSILGAKLPRVIADKRAGMMPINCCSFLVFILI